MPCSEVEALIVMLTWVSSFHCSLSISRVRGLTLPDQSHLRELIVQDLDLGGHQVVAEVGNDIVKEQKNYGHWGLRGSVAFCPF